MKDMRINPDGSITVGIIPDEVELPKEEVKEEAVAEEEPKAAPKKKSTSKKK